MEQAVTHPGIHQPTYITQVTHPGIHQATYITQVHTVLNIHSKYVVQDGTIPFLPKVLHKLTKLF